MQPVSSYGFARRWLTLLPRLYPMSFEKVQSISAVLQSKTKIRPKVGIIAGSGLGGLADQLVERDEFPYRDIPDFPISTGKSRF